MTCNVMAQFPLNCYSSPSVSQITRVLGYNASPSQIDALKYMYSAAAAIDMHMVYPTQPLKHFLLVVVLYWHILVLT